MPLIGGVVVIFWWFFFKPPPIISPPPGIINLQLQLDSTMLLAALDADTLEIVDVNGKMLFRGTQREFRQTFQVSRK